MIIQATQIGLVIIFSFFILLLFWRSSPECGWTWEVWEVNLIGYNV